MEWTKKLSITYQISTLTLSGIVPNGEHGGYSLKLKWTDSYGQSQDQFFDLYFFIIAFIF